MTYYRSLPKFLAGPLVCVVTTVVLMLCGELLVRCLDIAPNVGVIERWRFRLAKNPKIGYEPVPFLDTTQMSLKDYGYKGKSNDLGFRDRVHEVSKPVGTFRILVLGDSITNGLWMNDDNSLFTAVMERDLRARGLNVEVLNFGVSGYNTSQEVETLKEKGLRYKPDLVVVAYCLNDRYRSDGRIYERLLHDERRSRTFSVTRFSPFLLNSALYRYLVYSLTPNLRFGFRKLQDEQWARVGEDTVASSLGELRTISKREGLTVLVAMFPRFRPDGGIFETAEYEYVEEQTRANELGFLDLRGAFERCAAATKDKMSFDAFHPTLAGHLCAGEALASHLRSSGIFKGST